MFLPLASCEDETLDLSRGVGVVPAITGLNPAVFDSNDKPNTFIRFTLKVDNPSVSEAIIVVSYKGDNSKKQVASITTFPEDGTVVTVTLSQVATALEKTLAQIVAGDIINFQVLTVLGGKTYQSSAAFNAAVVCGYNAVLGSGTYRAVSATWAVDGPVTITVDPVDPYILYVAGLATLDGLTEDRGPLKLVVNPLNYSVTAVKTVLASVAWQYTNFAYEGPGLLNTCTGNYTFTFTITVAQGSFGSYAFTLTKM